MVKENNNDETDVCKNVTCQIFETGIYEVNFLKFKFL